MFLARRRRSQQSWSAAYLAACWFCGVFLWLLFPAEAAFAGRKSVGHPPPMLIPCDIEKVGLGGDRVCSGTNPYKYSVDRLLSAVRNRNYRKVVDNLNNGVPPIGQALVMAVRSRRVGAHAQIMQALIERGGDCLTLAQGKETVLSLLFSRNWDNQEGARLAALANLAEKCVYLNDIECGKMPLLHFLVSNCEKSGVFSPTGIEMLLENGLDVDIPLSSRNRATPLLITLKAVKHLSRHGFKHADYELLKNLYPCPSEASWTSPGRYWLYFWALKVVGVFLRKGARCWDESTWDSPFCLLLQKDWDGTAARFRALELIKENEGELNSLTIKGQSLRMFAVSNPQVSCQTFKDLVCSGLTPFFVRGEEPRLNLKAGNIEVKREICSIYSVDRKHHLQLLCMKVICENLKSTDIISELPIKLGLFSFLEKKFGQFDDELQTDDEAQTDDEQD